MVEVLAPLAVLPGGVVQTHASAVDLKRKEENIKAISASAAEMALMFRDELLERKALMFSPVSP